MPPQRLLHSLRAGDNLRQKKQASMFTHRNAEQTAQEPFGTHAVAMLKTSMRAPRLGVKHSTECHPNPNMDNDEDPGDQK